MLGRAILRQILSHVEGYQGALSPALRGWGRCYNAVLAKAKANAPLRADLGCSSRYSGENG